MPVDLNNLKTEFGPGHPLWTIQTECRQWHAEQLRAVLAACPPYPGGEGDGIVTVGDAAYLPSVYVLVRSLRAAGCSLPVRLAWHQEGAPRARRVLAGLGVDVLDPPPGRPNPKQLKTWAMVRAPWRRVLFLDADTTALTDPAAELAGVDDVPAVFWTLPQQLLNGVCMAFGVEHREEPMIEGGHVLLDRQQAWPALVAADWLNEQAAFVYRQTRLYDSPTWAVAFRAAGLPYRLLPLPERRGGSFLQPGRDGRPAFVHRITHKFLHGRPRPRDGRLPGDDACHQWLADLDRLKDS